MIDPPDNEFKEILTGFALKGYTYKQQLQQLNDKHGLIIGFVLSLYTTYSF